MNGRNKRMEIQRNKGVKIKKKKQVKRDTLNKFEYGNRPENLNEGEEE